MKAVASAPVVDISPRETLSSDVISESTPDKASRPKQLTSILHTHTVIVFAIAFLIVGASAIELGANYWSAHYIVVKSVTIKTAGKPIAGFNITIPSAELQSKLQTITTQPVTLTVGTQATQVSSKTIRSWLQITANKNKSEYYVHVNEADISPSLIKIADNYVRAPVNQVTANEDGTNQVVLAGQDGIGLNDPTSLKTQAQQVAKNVLGAKGMQFSTPLQTSQFQAVTPAAFSKVLVANVTTKKMWAFQNGQQVNSWLVSAGKPSTPTPLGEFHIYAKFTVQNMSGTNPNGSPYFQPNVPWVNYFYEGSAVHGVYWHPLSWFGAINSSHGCIGLPVDEAQWVFNWAPIGTTVIVHA